MLSNNEKPRKPAHQCIETNCFWESPLQCFIKHKMSSIYQENREKALLRPSWIYASSKAKNEASVLFYDKSIPSALPWGFAGLRCRPVEDRWVISNSSVNLHQGKHSLSAEPHALSENICIFRPSINCIKYYFRTAELLWFPFPFIFLVVIFILFCWINRIRLIFMVYEAVKCRKIFFLFCYVRALYNPI